MKSEAYENYKKVIDIIDDNFSNSYNEIKEKLEKGLGYPFETIANSFKFTFGITINEFKRKRKVANAMKAIGENPKIDLAELAGEVGFNDQSALTNAFKSEFGFNPGEAAKNPTLIRVPDKYEMLESTGLRNLEKDDPITSLTVSQLKKIISSQISKQVELEKKAEELGEHYDLEESRSREAINLSANNNISIEQAFHFIQSFNDRFPLTSALDEKAGEYSYTKHFIDYSLDVKQTEALFDELKKEGLDEDLLSRFEIRMLAYGFSLEDAKAVYDELDHYYTEDGTKVLKEDEEYFPEFFEPDYIIQGLDAQKYINSYLNIIWFQGGDIFRDGKLYKKSEEFLPSSYNECENLPEVFVKDNDLSEKDVELAESINEKTGRDIIDCYRFVMFINKHDGYCEEVLEETIPFKLFEKLGSSVCNDSIIEFVEKYAPNDIGKINEGVIDLFSIFNSIGVLLIKKEYDSAINKNWENMDFYKDASSIYEYISKKLDTSADRFLYIGDIPTSDIKYIVKSYLVDIHSDDVNDKGYEVKLPEDFSFDNYIFSRQDEEDDSE